MQAKDPIDSGGLKDSFLPPIASLRSAITQFEIAMDPASSRRSVMATFDWAVSRGRGEFIAEHNHT